MKKAFLLLALVAFTLPAMAEETNLLENGDFEEAETKSSPFGGTNVVFAPWEFALSGLEIETADVYHGRQAAKTVSNSTSVLRQDVSFLNDEVGQEYELTIHYKVIQAQDNDIALACEWTYSRPNEGEPHDAAVLTQTLPLSQEWKELKVRTTKPDNGSALYIGIKVNKKAQILFDDFSLIRVSPSTAIDNIQADEWQGNGKMEIYTPSGQRIDALQQGVNIIRQGNHTYKVIR